MANIIIYCIKDSCACYLKNTIYSVSDSKGQCINFGEKCTTPIDDFGYDFINWISVYKDNKYYGAHNPRNFGTLEQYKACYRNMQIDLILE